MLKRRLVVITFLTILLSSCSASPDSAPPASSGAVTVDHRFGSTQITGIPERVVALDTQWTDSLLALGITPVAVPKPDLVEGFPWQDLGDVSQLDLSQGIALEKIAAEKPDLIVGTWPIVDQATYDKLAGLAPTIAAPGGAAGSDWQVADWQAVLDQAGRATSRSDRAAALAEHVTRAIAEVRTAHPSIEGRTYTLAQYVVSSRSVIAVADPEDGASQVFTSLGMTLDPGIRAEGEKQNASRIELGAERIDVLTADLLTIMVNGGAASDLERVPGIAQLPGEVAVLDYATVAGLNVPSVLSVPYALEQLEPFLGAVGS